MEVGQEFCGLVDVVDRGAIHALLLLAVGQATQSELLEDVDASQSRVSEHLGCLAWCGFIAAERQGRTVRYRVIDDRAADLVELARSFLDDNETAVGCCTVLEGH